MSLVLDFPRMTGSGDYKALISATGMGPGHHGVDIPLSMDSMVRDTYLGIYPFAIHNGLQGTLSATGDALADFTVPAGLPASPIGRTYWLAAVAIQPGFLPQFSSVAIPIEIVP